MVHTIEISDKAYATILKHMRQCDEDSIQAVDDLTENAFGTVWRDLDPNRK